MESQLRLRRPHPLDVLRPAREDAPGEAGWGLEAGADSGHDEVIAGTVVRGIAYHPGADVLSHIVRWSISTTDIWEMLALPKAKRLKHVRYQHVECERS